MMPSASAGQLSVSLPPSTPLPGAPKLKPMGPSPPARPASPTPASSGPAGTSSAARPSTVGGSERTKSKLSRVSSAGILRQSAAHMAASPSNLAPDNAPPVDPIVLARERAVERARGLWRGLEILIYGGGEGLYNRSLHLLFLKEEVRRQDPNPRPLTPASLVPCRCRPLRGARALIFPRSQEERKNRAVAARAYMVMAVGGQLDEETLVSIAVTKMQRHFRKQRAARLDAARRQAEHMATIAILGVHRNAMTTMSHVQLSRRRGREHLALVERVAAHRILGFWRSKAYERNRENRKINVIQMQANVRRYLAIKRVGRFHAKEKEEFAKNVMSTVEIKNPEALAQRIQLIFKAHKQTVAAKREAFEAQQAAFPAGLRAELTESEEGRAVLAAAVAAEKHSVFLRREIALRAGTLQGAGPQSSRPEPLTAAATEATVEWLRDGLRTAIKETQSKGNPAAPASILAWAKALEGRARLEGALDCMRTA